jgi:hypothetical protein
VLLTCDSGVRRLNVTTGTSRLLRSQWPCRRLLCLDISRVMDCIAACGNVVDRSLSASPEAGLSKGRAEAPNLDGLADMFDGAVGLDVANGGGTASSKKQSSRGRQQKITAVGRAPIEIWQHDEWADEGES